MRVLFVALISLILAACSDSSQTTPPEPTRSSEVSIDSLSIRFDPMNKHLLISGLLVRPSSGERELFYHKGLLGDATLVNPITKEKLEISCASSDCRRFSFSLLLSRLQLPSTVQVEIRNLTQAQTFPGTVEDAGPTSFKSLWASMLRSGINLTVSNLVLSTAGKQSFFGLFLAPTGGTPLRVMHLSGSYGQGRIATNYSYDVDGKTSYVVGTEFGSAAWVTGRLQLSFGSGTLEAQSAF